MEFTESRPCIISCGVGNWYATGIERLERSLIYHGFAGDTIFWKNQYPFNSETHEENPYAFKIAAFKEAFSRGYNVVMWLDASFWCIQNPHKIFDIINEHGNFAFRSGYNCANTCTDDLLNDVGITRDEAENIPETATGIVGININNPKGKEAFEYWEDFCKRGLFKNSRTHNIKDSSDSRFLFGRQDQSAYSMALYKAKVEFNYIDYVAYYNYGNPEYDKSNCYFFIGGL
jgi:hypothetical protein